LDSAGELPLGHDQLLAPQRVSAQRVLGDERSPSAKQIGGMTCEGPHEIVQLRFLPRTEIEPDLTHNPVQPGGTTRQVRASVDWFTHQVYYPSWMVFKVAITRLAQKQLRKVPQHVKDNLMIWVMAVEHDGLEEVRKVPGYHDELLKGDRAGQRSIRLSRSYRAIYDIKRETLTFASVEEVSKHDY
jgi:toxin HigB-1